MANIEEEERIDAEKKAKSLEYAADTRKFEITLFWQRSLFFWGFIAATFVAFAAVREKSPDLSFPIACFGLVCSFAWTLVNRGSKYWQENWEQKVNIYQNTILDNNLFSNNEPVQENKGIWSARRYSVSRLAIALSDFTVLLWMYLTLTSLFAADNGAAGLKVVCLLVTAGYLSWMFVDGKTRT